MINNIGMLDLNWYYNLNHPPLTPPAWVFQPAWAFLYTTIFVAFILYAFKKTIKVKALGFALFFIQLLVNFCWTPAFFIMHNTGLALVILVLLDILVIWTIVEFYKVSKTSALLLLPYALWILFATYLNAGFHILN